MITFNSLGSNYDYQFARMAVFARNEQKYSEQLQEYLQKKYTGEVALVYKGREALRLALRLIKDSGQARMTKEPLVGICGYTCFAVYDAVIKEGFGVTYLDIDAKSLHFSLATLKQTVKENPQLKILIIQNTLGYPCDMVGIHKFCQEKGIILIEDLAHAIGSTYANGREAGTVGDFVALSFSQDKMIDGVTGGALVVRNQKYAKLLQKETFVKVGEWKQLIDRLYPLFTVAIRKTYGVGLGKILHHLLRKSGLLARPMDESTQIQTLSPWYCLLIYSAFLDLESNREHRRKIARIYREVIDSRIQLRLALSRSANLRFPLLVPQRESLIAYLKNSAVFVSDIWYDAPIGPKKFMQWTNYQQGLCPNAEKIADKMVNLPTHKNISQAQAKRIAQLVNKWLKANYE
ncbi:MAG: DegT/DnrJ/EryC1/StrS family aminotransferase [Patescibacteria group bacterium]